MVMVLALQKMIVWSGKRQAPYRDTELVYWICMSLLSCRYIESL